MQKEKPKGEEIAIAILESMLMDSQGFVSGNELSTKIGVSRVAIWGTLKKLEENGFIFEAKKNKGYRLQKEPDTISSPLLKAYLAHNNTHIPLLVLDEIDSTNSEAQRRLSSSNEKALAVVALKQTMGRGRLGRKWHSSSLGNLYLSFAFKPTFGSDKLSTFTPHMAFAMCHMLNAKYDLPVFVKWPNDLVLNNKKLSGMLAEARIDIDHIYELIFGIGLNIIATRKWPNELKDRVIAMNQEKNLTVGINRIAADIISTGMDTFLSFAKKADMTENQALWDKYDFLKGKDIEVFEGQTQLKGQANGINSDGTLKLKLPNGTIKSLFANEVSLSGAVT